MVTSYFPTSKDVCVRIPPRRPIKEKGYDPFAVTKSDPAIRVPAAHIRDFHARGLADLNSNQQQALLLCAQDYLQSQIRQTDAARASLSARAEQIRRELEGTDSAHVQKTQQRDAVQKEIQSLCLKRSGLVRAEQEAGVRAGALLADLVVAADAIVLHTPYFANHAHQISLMFQSKSERAKRVEALASWAAANMLDLDGFSKEMQKVGINTEPLLSSNGAKPINLTLEAWAAAADPLRERLAYQEQLIGEYLAREEQAYAPHSGVSHPRNGGLPDDLFVLPNEQLRALHAYKRLQMVRTLALVNDLVLQFDSNVRDQLTRQAELDDVRQNLQSSPNALSASRAELSALQKQAGELEAKARSLRLQAEQAGEAAARLGDEFAARLEQVQVRARRARQKGEDMRVAEEAERAQRIAKMLAEQAHLESVIAHTKPLLVEQLWRKDRFKFCNDENRNEKKDVYGQFRTKILDLADLYVANGGKLTSYALDKKFGGIHWETEIDSSLARLAISSDKNYRVLLDIADMGDPHVLFVGAHTGFERYIDNTLKEKPRDTWMPEWHAGLFGQVLAPAVQAHAQMAQIEKELAKETAKIKPAESE